MATVLLIQSNKAMAAFKTRSRKRLSEGDVKRSEWHAEGCPAMKLGYYDVVLLPGKVDAETFNTWAAGVPRKVHTLAVDAVIGVR